MKKIALFLSLMLIALVSCKREMGGAYELPPLKFVDKITHVNGSEISLEYDSEMRVKGVTYTNPNNPSLNRNYEVKYNLDMTNHTVTYDIISGDQRYVMTFNEYGAIDEFISDGYPRKVLSSFNYNEYHTVGAFHLELRGMLNHVNGGETRRIDWDGGTPISQINQTETTVEGVTYTYTTSLQYYYMKYRSNVLCNVNLFNLVAPEFLEHSNIPVELAATVSVFGTRSTYLPTDITIVKGRSQAGENYVKLSEVEREYTYDTDDSGYVVKIHSGKDDNDTKELLYTITYVKSDDSEK